MHAAFLLPSLNHQTNGNPLFSLLVLQANPGKYSLMICVELSSVHTTFDDNINDAILHAIFADGCAAAVLKGARKSECPKVRNDA